MTWALEKSQAGKGTVCVCVNVCRKGAVALNGVVQEDSPEKVTAEWVAEQGEDMNHVTTWGRAGQADISKH